MTDYGRSVKVMSVFGADAIEKIKSARTYREGVVCVINRKLDFDFDKLVKHHAHKV